MGAEHSPYARRQPLVVDHAGDRTPAFREPVRIAALSGWHRGEERLRLARLGIRFEASHDLAPHPVHVGILLIPVVSAEAGVAEQQARLASVRRWPELPGE